MPEKTGRREFIFNSLTAAAVAFYSIKDAIAQVEMQRDIGIPYKLIVRKIDRNIESILDALGGVAKNIKEKVSQSGALIVITDGNLKDVHGLDYSGKGFGGMDGNEPNAARYGVQRELTVKGYDGNLLVFSVAAARSGISNRLLRAFDGDNDGRRTALHEFGHTVDSVIRHWSEEKREYVRVSGSPDFIKEYNETLRLHRPVSKEEKLDPAQLFAEKFAQFYLSERHRKRLKISNPEMHSFFAQFEMDVGTAKYGYVMRNKLELLR